MSRPMKTLRGSCHCGAVTFEIETDFPELTTCDCSICRRKNALMVKVHESKFRLLRGDAALRLYQFHTFILKFIGNGAKNGVCILFFQAQQYAQGAEIRSDFVEMFRGNLSGHDTLLDASIREGGNQLRELPNP